MITLTSKNKMTALLCGISFLNLSLFALAGEMKDADDTTTGTGTTPPLAVSAPDDPTRRGPALGGTQVVR